MKKPVAIFVLSFLMILICSCASKPVILPPEWRYERNAIHVHIKADPQLNLYEGSAHALHLCVYQFRDPNLFQQLIEERTGLSTLLECSRFDPSVTGSRRFVVMPNQEIYESLDRAEGSRYVGVVAGYYQLQKDRTSLLFSVPVAQVKEKKTITLVPDRLDLNLYLWPQQIQEIRGR